MANLSWKVRGKTTRLLDTPFTTEEEFERLVYATSEILEVRPGSGTQHISL